MTDLRLYTLPQVAEATGLPLRSLQDGARAKPAKFVHVHTGGRHYMTEPQIIQMIKEQTVGVTLERSAEDARRDAIRKRLDRSRPPKV